MNRHWRINTQIIHISFYIPQTHYHSNQGYDGNQSHLIIIFIQPLIIYTLWMQEQPLYFKQTNSDLNIPIVNPLSLIPRQPTPPSLQIPGQLLDLQIDENLPMSKRKKITKKKLYRTQMCPDGRECRRRFTCNYAHNEKELRKPFKKRTKQCVFYQRGQCHLGAACNEYHGNITLMKKYHYQKNICQAFLNGTCNLGELCIYRHEKPEQRTDEITSGNKQEKEYIKKQQCQESEEISKRKIEKDMVQCDLKEKKKEVGLISLKATKHKQQKDREVSEEIIGEISIVEEGFAFDL